MPYRLACLCDLRDQHGRMLLLHRSRSPNKGLYSPIGGKLDTESGESPARCAQREIFEEAGLDIPLDRLHLAGLISENGFVSADGTGVGDGHWLLFYFKVLGPVHLDLPRDMAEGRLEWHDPAKVSQLAIPDTDRHVLFPMLDRVSPPAGSQAAAPGFFSLHIDATRRTPEGRPVWDLHQLIPPR